MRSGSTLLKALLAECPVVSNLPEIDYSSYPNSFYAQFEFSRIIKSKLAVIKLPSSLSSYRDYPYLVNFPAKRIVIFRRPSETYNSITRMLNITEVNQCKHFNVKLFIDYWCSTYMNIINAFHSNIVYLSYDNLVTDPITTTHNLFGFLGLSWQKGVEEYRKPQNYIWNWGADDGGEIIKTLKVQRELRAKMKVSIAKKIDNDFRVEEVYLKLCNLELRK